MTEDDNATRRKFLQRAATGGVVLLGMGVAGTALYKGIENVLDTWAESPNSVEGFRVQLGNHKDLKHYRESGEARLIEEGTEFKTKRRTRDGEQEVSTGIKVVTVTDGNGKKVPAFMINTVNGETQWLPIEPKLSTESIAAPVLTIIAKDGTRPFGENYVRVETASDGRTVFRFQPVRFNRSPVADSDRIDKQP